MVEEGRFDSEEEVGTACVVGEYGDLCTEYLDKLVKGKGDSGWGVTLYGR